MSYHFIDRAKEAIGIGFTKSVDFCTLRDAVAANASRTAAYLQDEVVPPVGALAVSALAVYGGHMLYVVAEYLSWAFLFFQAFLLFVIFTSMSESSDDAAESAAAEPKWIIYGQVYDLSPWIDRHPGGALVLQQTMGTDCSAVFASSHTFSAGRLSMVLGKYWVRAARAEEMDVSSRFHWAATPAHDSMRSGIREYFKGKSIKAPPWVLLWYAIWLVVLLWATRRWLLNGDLPTAFLLGVAIWYASVDIVHSGMHFSIFESPRANLALAYVFGMWSYLPSSWVRQHNLLHHSHTNHDDDPDLHHFHYFDDILAAWFHKFVGFYPIGGWRLSERTPFKNRYSRWMQLFPIYFLSSGLALSIIEPPILYLTKRCLGSKQTFAFPTWELTLAWTQYAIVVVTVCAVAGVHGAFAALLPLFTFGLLFYVFTQVSHANDDSNETGDSAGEDSEEWAVAQVRATRGDYSFDSAFWSAISGGLHLQSVHHVFPAVHWAHYPKIYQIVWQAAGEERAPSTLADAVRNHFAFVKRINGSGLVEGSPGPKTPS